MYLLTYIYHESMTQIIVIETLKDVRVLFSLQGRKKIGLLICKCVFWRLVAECPSENTPRQKVPFLAKLLCALF